MGIIRSVIGAASGSVSSMLNDQFLEVIEPYEMGEGTVMTKGVAVRKNSNKGTKDVISNGSTIHVYDNQFMMLVDGGKVVDYTAEPGYYTVSDSSQPSMFNGQFGEALKDTFTRFKYGGTTPTSQKVYYINLQEIKGIRFGTRNAVNYFDTFYNAELFLRAHGTYSIKITDPIKFYMEACPRNAAQVEITEINEQYLSEFMEALQAAINQMSADGTRISFVTSKARELGKYMADILDDDWTQMRGMQVQSVGIASISYDEESQKLINMRNQGAMMGDPSIREGYVQSAIAQGLQNAGSNANGSMAGFMGMGMGMNAAGGFMNQASQTNMMQMQMNQQTAASQPQQAAAGWTCSCGTVNTGKFCLECGKAKPAAAGWTCSCGAVNKGKFCSECGKAKPAGEPLYKCDKCGWEPEDPHHPPKFCPECGDVFDDQDVIG
ncbi:MAG: SPFH domain-containing protein [Blautia sp.]|nr:SPFH domain-containing protein [Blautia sp.]